MLTWRGMGILQQLGIQLSPDGRQMRHCRCRLRKRTSLLHSAAGLHQGHRPQSWCSLPEPLLPGRAPYLPPHPESPAPLFAVSAQGAASDCGCWLQAGHYVEDWAGALSRKGCEGERESDRVCGRDRES